MNKENFDRAKWMPVFIMAVVLIVIYYAFGNIPGIASAISDFLRIISPLLYGILFAYFLYVPHKSIEKLLKKVKIKKFTLVSDRARGISTIITFVLLLVLIVLVLAFLLPILFSSIADFARNIPGYWRVIVAFLDDLLDGQIFDGINTESWLVENTGSVINTFVNSAGAMQAARGVASFTIGVFNVIMGFFLALYILLYRDEIGTYLSRLNSAVFKNERRRERMSRYTRRINEVLLTFIASKSIDALCNFTAATLITTIFGVPYSILLGLIAGVFNFIPYIGSIISSSLITVIAFLTCSVPVAIGVMISIFVFQQLDGNYIEPRIMKTSLKMNPILVIMAVVIGGAYFGMAGMFLGVPIAVIIKQILQEYIESSEMPTEEVDDIRR